MLTCVTFLYSKTYKMILVLEDGILFHSWFGIMAHFPL